MRNLARFIAQHFKPLSFGYMAISFWPILIIRSEFNAPFLIALKYLSVPILAGCLWFGLRYKDEFIAICKTKPEYWFGLVFLPLLAVLFSGGLVLQANALIPPQKVFWLDGIVARKMVTGGNRSKSYVVYVNTQDERKKITVSRSAYEALQVGAYFNQKRRVGPFGFSYTYVWDD